ncbi:conjugal transfer protein TraG [Chitinophaga lutea]|uniref:Conjugal transfer protein TraG n=1 Tax=Chitinophaga lutea TaxID=2488634 RepID=A0A3N4Q1T0_9BACT|nr:conjugal transfer protein MobC [Chitinophaga lutea]RPE13159.1 conjugal transfer protein TraG [Chitinophaga lutea]
MQTGEDITALRKIIDFVRFGSAIVLLIHFYIQCHPLLLSWQLTHPLADRLFSNLSRDLPFFDTATGEKSIALLLLLITLAAAKGRKDENLKARPLVGFLLFGICAFYLSTLLLKMAPQDHLYIIYMAVTACGYLTILETGTKFSRLLHLKHKDDIFNTLNESFPQEETRLENKYSFNFAAQYRYRGQLRKSHISVISPFRALTVMGTPGSGKTFYVFREILQQAAAKGYTLFVFDYKYPDLTKIIFHHAKRNLDKYAHPLKFYVINFDDLSRSHRANPIQPQTFSDMTDAAESSRTLMLSLNRDWIKKTGDFWAESSITFFTALLWYLKKYDGGRFCTIPHAIELAQIDYKKLFKVLIEESEIQTLINVFISAWARGANEQLEGQIGSTKIALARLASPSIYWVLTGNDFTLDINNPTAPKIICAGSNPMRQQVYGPVLSLFVERMLKMINKPGQLHSALVLDEFASLTVNNIDQHIATARGRLCATCIGLQDLSQLRRDYGKEQADVIVNTCGNIISGQVLGDTAKLISDRIGKINQEKESTSISSSDTSVSKSTQLEVAIQPAKIANLSSGEFVGAVADTPQQKIAQKAFHCELLVDFDAVANEEKQYEDFPVIRNITEDEVMKNFNQVKYDIQDLINNEMKRIESENPTPEPPPTEEKKPVSL